MTPLHLSAILAASGLGLALVLAATASPGPLDPGAAVRIGAAAHRSLLGQLSASARAAIVALVLVLGLALSAAQVRGLALWPIGLTTLGGALLSLGVTLGAARASCFTIARLVGTRSRGVLLSAVARGSTSYVAGAAALGLLVSAGLALVLPKGWPGEAFPSLALGLVAGATLPQLVLSRPLLLVSSAVESTAPARGLDHTTLVRFVAASGTSTFVATGFALSAALLVGTLLTSAAVTHGDEALLGGFCLLVPPLGVISALLGVGTLAASDTEEEGVAWIRSLLVASAVFVAGLWSLSRVVPDGKSAPSLAAFSTLLLLLVAVVGWFERRPRTGSLGHAPLLTALWYVGLGVGLAVALGGSERLVSITDLLATLGSTALGAGLVGLCLECTWRTSSGLDAATLLATEGDPFGTSALGARPAAASAWARVSLSLVALVVGAVPLALGSVTLEHLLLGAGLAVAGFAGLSSHLLFAEHARALAPEAGSVSAHEPEPGDDAARPRAAPSLALVQQLLEQASERGTFGYVAWLVGPLLAATLLGRVSPLLGGVLGVYVFATAILGVAPTSGTQPASGGFRLPHAALATASFAMLLRAALGAPS